MTLVPQCRALFGLFLLQSCENLFLSGVYCDGLTQTSLSETLGCLPSYLEGGLFWASCLCPCQSWHVLWVKAVKPGGNIAVLMKTNC